MRYGYDKSVILNITRLSSKFYKTLILIYKYSQNMSLFTILHGLVIFRLTIATLFYDCVIIVSQSLVLL